MNKVEEVPKQFPELEKYMSKSLAHPTVIDFRSRVTIVVGEVNHVIFSQRQVYVI